MLPQDPKASPSTWEMILKAEDFRRRSFGDLDKNKDGFVDAAVSNDASSLQLPLSSSLITEAGFSHSNSKALPCPRSLRTMVLPRGGQQVAWGSRQEQGRIG
jgi:hypothetical protein